MTQHQRRIERAAKAAVGKARVDAMLLAPLVERLMVYSDRKLGEGEKALVVRAKGNPAMSPDEALREMRDDPAFAAYFIETSEADATLEPVKDADAYEAETQRLIEAEFRTLAPDGNLHRISPTTKVSIAARIREERGGRPLRPVSPTRRERPSSTDSPSDSNTPTASPPVAGSAVARLKEARRNQPGV